MTKSATNYLFPAAAHLLRYQICLHPNLWLSQVLHVKVHPQGRKEYMLWMKQSQTRQLIWHTLECVGPLLSQKKKKKKRKN